MLTLVLALVRVTLISLRWRVPAERVSKEVSTLTGQEVPTSQSAFFGDNALKLGVFCLNVSGGMMLSGAAKPKLDWDENAAVAKVADETGWEFLLPIGRWRGHGGNRSLRWSPTSICRCPPRSPSCQYRRNAFTATQRVIEENAQTGR